MRHRKSFNHLGRTASHRKAMLANMASSLILHKRIETTTAKAKALRMYLEPLITKSKNDSTHSRRVVFSYLQNKDAVSELFREVSPKIIDRPGGYTRILKTGTRLGDSADMCIIELVDYNENLLKAKEDSKDKSGRRRRRGGKKKPQTAEVQTEQQEIETEQEPVTDDSAENNTEKAETTEAVEAAEATEIVEATETVETKTEDEVKETVEPVAEEDAEIKTESKDEKVEAKTETDESPVVEAKEKTEEAGENAKKEDKGEQDKNKEKE